MTLVEDNEQLFLLGAVNGKVHYLKAAVEASLWIWQTKELDLE